MTAFISLFLSLAGLHAAPLTTAAAVRAIPHDSAGGPRPVHLRNVVVTYHHAEFLHLYVQDDTGGVHVRVAKKDWPAWVRAGEVVHVRGLTPAGPPHAYAVSGTTVESAKRQKELKPVPFDASAGRAQWLDAKLVAVRGRVRNRQAVAGVTTLTVVARGGEIAVVFLGKPPPAAAGVGAEITARGVCTTSYTYSRDRDGGKPPRILVPDESVPEIHAAGLPNLFATPAVTVPQIKELGAISGEGRDLVRVGGVVTGREFRRAFIQDGTSGLTVKLADGECVPEPGRRAEVVGTPTRMGDSFGLGDARIRDAGETGVVAPLDVALGQLAGGGFHARLVRLAGTVLDVSFTPRQLRLSVFDQGHFVEAFLEPPPNEPLPRLVPGARVSLVGVCDEDRAGGAVLLLRTPADVTVTGGPPFWTAERAWALFGGFGAVCAIGALGLFAMRAQVRRAAEQIQRQFDERAKLEDRLVEATRLEVVGRLAGGVAHEFNNLLTVINGCATLLTEVVDGGTPAELADDIRRAGERAADLSTQLLTISRPRAVVPQPMDLNACVRSTAHLIGRTVGDRITLKVEPDVGLPVVKGHPSLVSQILFNLVGNARDAMPGGGTVVLRTATLVDGDTVWARLSVIDTGSGMPEAVRARMFEPFFTTKEVGKGTGLGLATVRTHVLALGGRLHCTSELGRGTTFDIDLPTTASVADDMTPLPLPLAYAPPPCRDFAPVVLLVEDDESVRAVAQKILEVRGLVVLSATSADDALRVADDHREQIDLLMTDLSLPGMNGRELAARLGARRPGLRVLYVSGFSRGEAVEQALLDANAAFVQKPFTSAALLAEVTRVLTAPA